MGAHGDGHVADTAHCVEDAAGVDELVRVVDVYPYGVTDAPARPGGASRITDVNVRGAEFARAVSVNRGSDLGFRGAYGGKAGAVVTNGHDDNRVNAHY